MSEQEEDDDVFGDGNDDLEDDGADNEDSPGKGGVDAFLAALDSTVADAEADISEATGRGLLGDAIMNEGNKKRSATEANAPSKTAGIGEYVRDSEIDANGMYQPRPGPLPEEQDYKEEDVHRTLFSGSDDEMDDESL